MGTRHLPRTLVAALTSGALVATVAAVSAAGYPSGAVAADAGTPPAAVAQSNEVPLYQAIPSTGSTTIPRGRWVDIASYRTPTGGPVTHSMSLQLDIRRATGTRPYYVKVSWVRDKGAGWDRTGSQVYAVPSKWGDNPFYVAHEHTIAGVDGLSKAQIYIPGSGSVTLRSSLIQAIAFPAY